VVLNLFSGSFVVTPNDKYDFFDNDDDANSKGMNDDDGSNDNEKDATGKEQNQVNKSSSTRPPLIPLASKVIPMFPTDFSTEKMKRMGEDDNNNDGGINYAGGDDKPKNEWPLSWWGIVTPSDELLSLQASFTNSKENEKEKEKIGKEQKENTGGVDDSDLEAKRLKNKENMKVNDTTAKENTSPYIVNHKDKTNSSSRRGRDKKWS